jgi:methylated-DNA-[protein]-cysteine S-methyltransferase
MQKITPFQEKVFSVVKKIPKGKTLSYKQIAIATNSSPRAVGQALKRNHYPIKIPCHRVIRSNGELGGYTFNGKFSPQRKEKLLRKEKEQPSF